MIGKLTRPPTLTSAVADAIQEAILRGDMKPGEPLHEVDLGQSLHTSRGTVREALRQLQAKGLVEIFPYRGAFVTQLSAKKIREIYTLRARLEPFAVRLAIENNAFTKEIIAELQDMIVRLRELETQGHFAELISTDIAFHELLASGCQHELLLHMLKELQALTYLFIFHTKLFHSDVIDDELSHKSILETVLSADPESVEQVVQEHILEAGESLVLRLEAMQQPE